MIEHDHPVPWKIRPYCGDGGAVCTEDERVCIERQQELGSPAMAGSFLAVVPVLICVVVVVLWFLFGR